MRTPRKTTEKSIARSRAVRAIDADKGVPGVLVGPSSTKAAVAATQRAIAAAHVEQKKSKRNVAHISAARASDAMMSDVTEWITSGFPNIDRILGGGWAVGRASEVFGKEGCGKTALLHMAIRSAQRAGGFAVLHDFEGDMTRSRIAQLGIDPETLVISRADYAEEAWDLTYAMLDQMQKDPPPGPVFVGWDSIAFTAAKAEYEAGSEDATMAALARVMGRQVKTAVKRLQEARTHLMFINQEREDIKNKAAWKEAVTPGGSAVKYYAAQRVRVYRKNEKSGEQVVGYHVTLTTRKCKLCPPHQQAAFYLDFMEGPSMRWTLYYALAAAKVLRPKGSHIAAPWTKRLFYRKDWPGLMEDAGFREKAEAAMTKVVSGSWKAEERDED